MKQERTSSWKRVGSHGRVPGCPEKRTPGKGMGHAAAAGGGTRCDGSGAELDLRDLGPWKELTWLLQRKSMNSGQGPVAPPWRRRDGVPQEGQSWQFYRGVRRRSSEVAEDVTTGVSVYLYFGIILRLVTLWATINQSRSLVKANSNENCGSS